MLIVKSQFVQSQNDEPDTQDDNALVDHAGGAVLDHMLALPGVSTLLDIFDDNKNSGGYYAQMANSPTIADSQRMIQSMLGTHAAQKPEPEDAATKKRAQRSPLYVSPELMSGIPRKPKPENV